MLFTNNLVIYVNINLTYKLYEHGGYALMQIIIGMGSGFHLTFHNFVGMFVTSKLLNRNQPLFK